MAGGASREVPQLTLDGSGRVLFPPGGGSASRSSTPEWRILGAELKRNATRMSSVRVGDYLWCLGGEVQVGAGVGRGEWCGERYSCDTVKAHYL